MMMMIDYKNRAASDRGENCTGNYTVDDPHEQTCDFDIEDLRSNPDFDCTLENSYGYHNNKPCVLLKINKVQIFVCLFDDTC